LRQHSGSLYRQHMKEKGKTAKPKNGKGEEAKKGSQKKR
jgi:hypothetical protein